MNTAQQLAPKKRGQQLKNAERQVLISKMIDMLCEGYSSTYALSKKLRVSRDTIESYRPLADDIIGKMKLDRNVVRNLQVRRTYEIIEMLMDDLKGSHTVKDRASIYGSIYKFSSHLALITGLNVETHVNLDPTKLVIIRSKTKKDVKNSSIDVDPVPSSDDGVNLPQLTSGGLQPED